MMQLYDVAVVGAGMAGIIAARDLSQRGYSVVLLEARNQIGGRTRVERHFGNLNLEMGGGYMHWTQPTVWTEIEKYGLELKAPLNPEKHRWLADGKVHSGTADEYAAVAGPLIGRFFADARSRFPLPVRPDRQTNSDIEQQSIEDRIRAMELTQYERDVLDGALSGVVSSYTEQGLTHILHATAVSFGSFDAFMETAGFWSIKGGTKALIEAIHHESQAEIRLSTPIAAVDDTGKHVAVTTKAGSTIWAKTAILAVPLNTLSDIDITPTPPAAVQQLIESGNPVKGGKIWVRVKGEIEPINVTVPVGKGPINAFRTEFHHDGDTLIMGIMSDMRVLEKSTDDHKVAAAVEAALRPFLPDVEVVGVAQHDWLRDEYSKGGWMMHRPGGLLELSPTARLPHGRIHFSGGDFAAVACGSIDGALESGVAAARRVARFLDSEKPLS